MYVCHGVLPVVPYVGSVPESDRKSDRLAEKEEEIRKLKAAIARDEVILGRDNTNTN